MKIKIIIIILFLFLIIGCSDSRIDCSSLSCQSEDFCSNLGFDREWSEKVK